MKRFIVAVCGVVVLPFVASAQPADFPFERDLLMETQPMRPGKRIPSLTIQPDGRAEIDLWCRSIRGRITLTADTIMIMPEVPPQDLAQTPPPVPQMQSAGQCTEPRLAADVELLTELTQATSWRLDRGTVTLTGGPRPLRFGPNSN